MLVLCFVGNGGVDRYVFMYVDECVGDVVVDVYGVGVDVVGVV